MDNRGTCIAHGNFQLYFFACSIPFLKQRSVTYGEFTLLGMDSTIFGQELGRVSGCQPRPRRAGTTEMSWAHQDRVQTPAARNQVSSPQDNYGKKGTHPSPQPHTHTHTHTGKRVDQDNPGRQGGRAEGSGQVQTGKLCAKRPVGFSDSAQGRATRARPSSDALPSCRSACTVAATAAEPEAPRPATETVLSPPSMLASAGLMTSCSRPALQVTQNQGAAPPARPG